jgi:Phage major capsid protein E
MPINLDLYKTEILLEAISLTPIKTTFLRDNFFSNVREFITESCKVDIKKKNRVLAPVVSRRKRGQVVDRYPYRTIEIEPPYIAPVRTLTIEDLERRAPGEDLFDPMSIEERQQQLLADDLEELGDMIDRREEWMAAQVLLDGKMSIPSDDPEDPYEFFIDYSFTQKVTLTGTALWSATATSNPFMDFESIIQLVTKNSTVVPDTALMSSVTWRWFCASEEVQRTLFARSAGIGTFPPRAVMGPGARLVAQLTDPALDLWTYTEYYRDSADGLTKQMIADGKVIVLQAKGDNRLYCSAVKQMDPDTTQFKTYAARRVPRVYADVQDQIRYGCLTSKTLPAPVDVNNWAVLTVL